MFSNLFIRFLSGQAGLVKRWFMPPLRLSSGLSQNRRIVLYIRHSKARTGRCVCILLVTFPILGRPGIVAIRIRSGVVRIQITRRTITVVGIAAKTRSRLPVRSFNLPFTGSEAKVPMLSLPGDGRIWRGLQPLYSACGGVAHSIKAWADPAELRCACVAT